MRRGFVSDLSRRLRDGVSLFPALFLAVSAAIPSFVNIVP
jgi:hypothetical protein